MLSVETLALSIITLKQSVLVSIYAVFHPYIMARGGGGQNGVCKKLGGLRVMRECEARP